MVLNTRAAPVRGTGPLHGPHIILLLKQGRFVCVCESGTKDGGVLLLPAHSSFTNLEPGECPVIQLLLKLLSVPYNAMY